MSLHTPLKPADVEVFSEAITHYFEMITGEKARVRTAYVQDEHLAPAPGDYNGLIEVRGAYQGSVCFSAPRGLLSHVLLRMGQHEYSDADHLDVVGEIANTLAGRARRVFGEGLEITPPTTYCRTKCRPPLSLEIPSYVIPFDWKGYEAMLVVQLRAA